MKLKDLFILWDCASKIIEQNDAEDYDSCQYDRDELENVCFNAMVECKVQFIKERDKILSGPVLHPDKYPTKEFCQMYLFNLPEEGDCPSRYAGRDAEDYWTWAKGLLLDTEEGELEANHINIHEAIEHYGL